LSAPPQESIREYLEARRLRVDEELEKLLPGTEEHPPSIHQAMRHSVFAGGKRLRPILCWESGQLFRGEEKSLLQVGCALELIHTYSLIHDDLPAIDNDDLRRGKPTCHRAYGEATAILAGDALLTLAFEVLSQPSLLPAERSLRIIHEISHAIGTRGGMVGGQVVDVETTGSKTDASTLEYIHRAKTGAFICAAVRSGALCANAPEEDLARITAYGEKVGLAFQIADDLLDITGSKEQLGKSAGKDDQQQKATYPAIHGVEESRRIASRLVREACDLLEPYGSRAQRLREIAHFLIERNN
jgi:geranylgeranyl diphosphate synthase type II